MATLLLLSRFLGAKDMGSNFYPFTAARKGNKLVTKGLFSKLDACMINSPVPNLTEIVTCFTIAFHEQLHGYYASA